MARKSKAVKEASPEKAYNAHMHNDRIAEIKENMKNWARAGVTVLLEGEKGVGKTAMVKAVCKELGLTCAYASGPTMDPYLNFRGIPHISQNEDGEKRLEFVLPEFMTKDIDILFIDEVNRAPAQVRNALFEIIQNKTLDGKKIGVRTVWTAINPEGGDYDVDVLDPAFRDRFVVQCKVPHQASIQVFSEKYGEDMGARAVAWWNQLPDNIKKHVSPRRLDEAVQYYLEGETNVNIDFIIPQQASPASFRHAMARSIVGDEMESAWEKRDQAKIQSIVNNPVKIGQAFTHMFSMLNEDGIPSEQAKFCFFFDSMDDEVIIKAVLERPECSLFIESHKEDPKYKRIYDIIIGSGASSAQQHSYLQAVFERWEARRGPAKPLQI